MINGFTMSTDTCGAFDKADYLYTACKAIVGVDGGNVLRTDGKALVAFWDGASIRAGFGATETERNQIATDTSTLYVR